MKIDNDKKPGLLENLIKPAHLKPSRDKGIARNENQGILDKVELSTRKDEINRLKEQARMEPAVRQDRVERIREQLEAKTYNVRGELVAKSLMKSQILDEIL